MALINKNSSILNTIKDMLGTPKDIDVFDTTIIANINAAIESLKQIGVASDSTFFILGPEETFGDFVSEEKYYGLISNYIYGKTKMGFDPPSSGIVYEQLKSQTNEYEWRLLVAFDGGIHNAVHDKNKKR